MSITREQQKECFEEIGFPPERESISVEPSYEEGDDEQQLFVEVFAEQYLGTSRFESLENAFGKISGVNSVIHEDRDVFLVESTLSDEELEEEAWKIFMSLSEEVKKEFE